MNSPSPEARDSGRTDPPPAAGPKPRIPDCPLARTAEAIGPWWTLELLHEVFDGHTRFTEIRRNLALSPEVLTERIAALTAKGLLETEDTDPDPGDPRYRPTARGRALRPLLLVMAAWGNHRLAPEERSLVLVDAATGVAADPLVVDRLTGRPLDTPDFVFARGPRASDLIAARYPEIPERR
ncbi:winged helix-turn-helix transcriptional regulator [Streptomyces sp. NRRL F-5727]|uniref:winged helix-turn-helix transcriptional regulator n=1 Tax=Streptomyces sp. NRRL F-5727 TaxID=1463871 RepID=UPI000A77422B|nr:helix-turn-helix domain-containing protein [Streptomyces sp. NRRL F-5727]